MILNRKQEVLYEYRNDNKRNVNDRIIRWKTGYYDCAGAGTEAGTGTGFSGCDHAGLYKASLHIQCGTAFLFRIDQTVSIMREKTTEVALRFAAEKTAEELEFELIDFSMYPDTTASQVRYLYFMELGRMPEGLKAKEIRFVLEQKLAEANPSMGSKGLAEEQE